MKIRAMAYGGLALVGLLAGCGGPPKTQSEEYPGAWSEPSAEVIRVLASNSVRGCGEFYQKASSYGPEFGEFLLYCTRDGKTWVAWKVWTHTNKVLGPDPNFVHTSGITPPEGID